MSRHPRYRATIDGLFARLPMYQRVGATAFKKDLTNIRALCDALDHPHDRFRSIHVAGTNGKGSVTHIIAAGLMAGGYRTGCYTSPHYVDFRERIKIDGHLITEAEVVDFVDRIDDHLDRIEPSFFEITVAMAFDHFARHAVDCAVVEVGLGGRLDSTNIICPDLSVITNIGWDHMDMLGDTLPEIAAEKAGIIKPGVPILVGEHQPEVHDVFVHTARERGARLSLARDVIDFTEFSDEGTGSRFTVDGQDLRTDLSGTYQAKNLQTAIAALRLVHDAWPVSDHQLADGLRSVRSSTHFLGRWMVLDRDPVTIADSAHNINGLQLAIDQFTEIASARRHIVLGVVRDKDLDALLPLLPTEAAYHLARPDVPRGLDAHELADALERHGLVHTVYSSVGDALRAARSAAGRAGTVLVTGSIFVVGEALARSPRGSGD